MNSDTKASPSGFVMSYDVPFKILSEKQMECIQFKARQRLLQLKEEEEWKKYCEEQNCNDIEEYGTSSKNLLNSNDIASKDAEQNLESVSTVQIVDHKANPKGTKKPVVVNQSKKSKGIQCESASLTQVSHFQKTRLGSTLGFPVSRKLNVLNVQKNSEDTINLGNIDGEDGDSATDAEVQTSQRPEKTKFPNLDSIELPRYLEEIRLCSKINRNVGFTLPYALKQQRYLARIAYLPSFSKPKVQCRKNPLPANKSMVKTNSSGNFGGITAPRNINSKFQNLSSCQTKKLRPQEKINTDQKREIVKEAMKSTSVKPKKIAAKLEKEVASKVVEFVLNETLDEVISEVEHEEEEKRKSSVYSQLNSILQKLNDIESEESAIHRKWGTLAVEKLHQENTSAALLQTVVPNMMLKSVRPVQEKSTQSIMDEMFRETTGNPEVGVQNSNSETATTEKKCLQNSSANKDCAGDARYVINPTLIGSDKQTVPLSAIIVQNVNSEREVIVTPESLKRIYNYKKSFHQHLKQSSQMSKQHCNFWNVSTETADQILEECLQEIAEELCEIPSSLIVDLYNQEFDHSTVQS